MSQYHNKTKSKQQCSVLIPTNYKTKVLVELTYRTDHIVLKYLCILYLLQCIYYQTIYFESFKLHSLGHNLVLIQVLGGLILAKEKVLYRNIVQEVQTSVLSVVQIHIPKQELVRYTEIKLCRHFGNLKQEERFNQVV